MEWGISVSGQKKFTDKKFAFLKNSEHEMSKSLIPKLFFQSIQAITSALKSSAPSATPKRIFPYNKKVKP